MQVVAKAVHWFTGVAIDPDDDYDEEDDDDDIDSEDEDEDVSASSISLGCTCVVRPLHMAFSSRHASRRFALTLSCLRQRPRLRSSIWRSSRPDP